MRFEKKMKSTARILLVGIAISAFYLLWQKGIPPKNQLSEQPNPTPEIVSAITPNAISADISPTIFESAPVQRASNPLADRLATLHSKLHQWQDSLIHNPDDEEGRKQLLNEILRMVTDENVVDVIQSLSPEELNTPFGIGALHHWMGVDSGAATAWLAARPDSSKEQILAVAEDWTTSPDRLQKYLDELPQSSWKQNFLEQTSSAELTVDPSEAVKLAMEMDSGEAQTNLLRSAACKWVSTDPNAALDWISSVNDLPLREQLVASAAQAYALTDPSLSMAWLTSQVKSPPLVKDAVCNILETWVSADPASAAQWTSAIPDRDLKMNASRIVFNHWSQTDPTAANAWAQNLPANDLNPSHK
jgi:hypothetical protein